MNGSVVNRSTVARAGLYCFGAVFTSILLFYSSARATTVSVVNDVWSDGTRTDPTAANGYSEYGTDGDADGSIESSWYVNNSANMSASAGHLNMINNGVSTAASSSYFTYFTPEGSEVTLANPGDFIKVTWVFTPNAAATQTNTSQNFRLALMDTPGAASRQSADGSPLAAAYTGYAMFMNMSIATASNPTANLGNANPFRLMRRNVSTVTDALGTSANWLAIGTTGATSGTHGYDSGTQYTFTMLATRNASSGIDFDVEMAGGTLNNTGLAQVLFTDTTPGTTGGFTFDSFNIRPSSSAGTADNFDTTLFKVETNVSLVSVPEPASLVMMGFGMGIFGLMMLRRGRTTS